MKGLISMKGLMSVEGLMTRIELTAMTTRLLKFCILGLGCDCDLCLEFLMSDDLMSFVDITSISSKFLS